jgi:hypothetical protein
VDVSKVLVHPPPWFGTTVPALIQECPSDWIDDATVPTVEEEKVAAALLEKPTSINSGSKPPMSGFTNMEDASGKNKQEEAG